MKIKHISLSIMFFITLFFSFPLFAIDYSSNCNAALSVIDPADRNSALAIEAAFADYTPYYNEADGVYYLNFVSETTLDMDRNFSLSVNNGETRDIYICNFNIRPTTASSTPFITITNTSNKTVHILNSTLSGIKEGLKLVQSIGTGGFSVVSASITGDSSASSTGITVNAAGAVLNGVTLTGVVNGINVQSGSSGVSITSADVTCSAKTGSGIIAAASATITGGEFTNCSNGIKVSSNNVHISDADIHENKYGVYVDAGITGTDVENTLIYANDSGLNASDRRQDGIFFADEPRDLEFYDVVDGAAVNLSDTSSVSFNYGARTPYIVLPEMPATGSQVELYITDFSACAYQSCTRADEGSRVLAIDAGEVLAAGITDVTLPASLRNQNLVAVYKHPELGVTSISKVFSFANELPGDIAFVATPYDIPTSGGNVSDSGSDVDDAADSGSDDEEAQSGSDSSSGTQMASGEGGSVDVGNLTDSVGAAAGAKCSLMVGDTFRSFSLVANLWWLIFATGLLGSLRTVLARIRKK